MLGLAFYRELSEPRLLGDELGDGLYTRISSSRLTSAKQLVLPSSLTNYLQYPLALASFLFRGA